MSVRTYMVNHPESFPIYRLNLNSRDAMESKAGGVEPG